MIVSPSYINKERAERGKMPLSDQFIADEFKKYMIEHRDLQRKVDAFALKMINEVE